MSSNIRYTKEYRQEQISRKQLAERLVEVGLIPVEPLDLGEDFIVHIYLHGQATGVTFHLQEKSITNLLERRRDEYIVYDFKSKDLLHWAEFSEPVVLIVWDIKRREGRWILVEDALADLDRRRPAWRCNKTTVRSYIPWKNTTDDTGLVQLRQRIGRAKYPLIIKNRPVDEFTIQFAFPPTAEGRDTFEALQQSVETGDEVTIPARFIKDLGFPEWWKRWFGEYDPDKGVLKIGPTSSTEMLPARIDFIDETGQVISFSFLEFRVVRRGTKLIELSNNHQRLPIHFSLILRDTDAGQKVTANVAYSLTDCSVTQAQELLSFRSGLARGGTLELQLFDSSDTPITFTVPAHPEAKPHQELIQLIEDLSFLQKKIVRPLRIPKTGITPDDWQGIFELKQIIRYGKLASKAERVTVTLKRPALELLLDQYQQGKQSNLTIGETESWVELFGQEIPTGPINRHIAGSLDQTAKKLAEKINMKVSDDAWTVEFTTNQVTEIFPDWFRREAKRLSELIQTRFDVEAVYLFGSLVWSEIFGPDTDIDLALAGLPTDKYLWVLDFVQHESTFPIDLVFLEELPASFQQRILSEGQLLIGRKTAETAI